MSSNFHFFYKEEFWCISALMNRASCDVPRKIEELQDFVQTTVKSISEKDLKKIQWNPTLLHQVLELAQNISISTQWISYLTNFPFQDEKTHENFDTIGYFRFNVEYYPNQPEKKKTITSACLQQIPAILHDRLAKWDEKAENRGIKIDTESPIYIFATSNGSNADQQWNQATIEENKEELGAWIEIYSGQWPDYSESLYNRRIQNNLSNRLSELHFIRRNSGFIYMAPDNYRMFFDSYMRSNVLEPTFQVRTIQFTFLQINQSLDKLYQDMQNSGQWISIDTLSNKIDNLKQLRGVIQTKLTGIYNELDYNRRQHYTTVLTHLLEEFRIQDFSTRINTKFELISDSLTKLYQQKSNEAQELQENRMNQLSVLFGLEILIGLTEFVLGIRSAFSDQDLFAGWFQTGVGAVILVLSIITAKKIFSDPNKQVKKKWKGKTVDAIIIHEDQIVLIKRKFSPFKDHWALPGGFIEKKESREQAVIREVKEETGLKIKPQFKVGYYDTPGRDPRGPVATTAFQCQIVGSLQDLASASDAKIAKLIPIKELHELQLAFDHKEIIDDALTRHP